MKNITLLFLFSAFWVSQIQAQAVFDAAIHTAVAFGDVSSPINEGPQQIIDQDPMTKFLDFNIFDGMGFEVDLLGVAIAANSIKIVTANDSPERDPTDYEIFGSNDGTNYSSIATGSIPCVSDRFLSRTFQFSNTTTYTYYRINFTGTCTPSNINQVADVQLFATIGSAPVLISPIDDILIETSPGLCEGFASFDVSAMDAEDGTIVPVQSLGLPSESLFPLGDSPIVFTAADSDGNVVSCGFTIMVNDTEAPVIDCPTNITVNVAPGTTEAIVDYDVFASDNCSTINPLVDFIPLGTIDGNSYYLSETGFTAADAFIDAEIEDRFLGTIRNASDNQFLFDAIQRIMGTVDVTIGYNDVDVEGVFVWHNGDLATYSNWNLGEPNNSGAGGGPENYTAMLTDGAWNDVDELGIRPYLLEIDFELLQTEGLASGSAFPLGTTTNTFEVTDAIGNISTCSFEITVSDAVGIEDQELAAGITISPNPTNDKLTINNVSGIQLANIVIYDISGKAVHAVTMNALEAHQTIDVSRLNAGFYLLKIKGEKGIATKRIIKR